MNNGWTYFRLVAASFFWGASFNAGALALQAMPPLTVTAWRFIIASVLMLMLFFSKERPTWQRIRSSIWAYILLGVVGVFVTNALQFTALKHTSPIHPALIMATNPIVTAILAALLLKEKLHARQAMGMLLSVIGVLFVITKGSFLQLTSVSIGDVMAMGANISWALYGVLGRKFLKDSTPLATTTMTMLVATICLLPFASVQHADVSNDVLTTAWLSIAYIGSFGAVLTFLWWNQGIATVGASKTSVFFNLVPVVTVIISAIMGEPVGWIQIVGTFFVIMGVVIATLTVREQRRTTSMGEKF
ncbi:DMT family transporter [Paenibacillus sp. sptzw28]|uniref:DMT family transporter n=1 Tax=Paenibacillus sp. sptzw28 TaxID=715179 RepID=UPI001C6DEF93|nr:DMT family transporter [Paenibacillus sp. sptzw28]QYR21041.1 DMT family transporter [Paenibacillus sp. sptzw28]